MQAAQRAVSTPCGSYGECFGQILKEILRLQVRRPLMEWLLAEAVRSATKGLHSAEDLDCKLKGPLAQGEGIVPKMQYSKVARNKYKASQATTQNQSSSEDSSHSDKQCEKDADLSHSEGLGPPSESSFGSFPDQKAETDDVGQLHGGGPPTAEAKAGNYVGPLYGGGPPTATTRAENHDADLLDGGRPPTATAMARGFDAGLLDGGRPPTSTAGGSDLSPAKHKGRQQTQDTTEPEAGKTEPEAGKKDVIDVGSLVRVKGPRDQISQLDLANGMMGDVVGVGEDGILDVDFGPFGIRGCNRHWLEDIT